MSTVIVGEAPGPRDVPGTPLLGKSGQSSGARLRAMGGFDEKLWAVVPRVNLLPEYPGSRWPRRTAEASAKNLVHCLLRDRDLILLGRKVAQAFGLHADAEFMEWVESPLGVFVAVIPHPSGRTRNYNDPAFRKQVGTFLRRNVFRRRFE